jgi:hypothetical protein
MEAIDIQPWLFRVEPLEGESLSHFLGRFRRANELTPTRLGKMALAAVVGVEGERLQEMLPPPGVGMKLEPIRLCGACYAQSPCHRIEWQFKTTQGCDRHGLRLLSECPNCGARFKVPALWVDGWCQRCFLTFSKMTNSQKSL